MVVGLVNPLRDSVGERGAPLTGPSADGDLVRSEARLKLGVVPE